MALTGSITAWTAASSALNIDVHVSPGGTAGKAVTSVTGIGETFSITQGKAQKISGVELYEIQLGDAQFSNLIRIDLALLNPLDMGQVLNNPNAFIEAAIYYPGTGADQITLDYDGTIAIPDPGASARAIMTKVVGGTYLRPSVTGQSKLYIVASINTPGGAPPGQQGQLTDLRFYIDVRMKPAP